MVRIALSVELLTVIFNCSDSLGSSEDHCGQNERRTTKTEVNLMSAISAEWKRLPAKRSKLCVQQTTNKASEDYHKKHKGQFFFSKKLVWVESLWPHSSTNTTIFKCSVHSEVFLITCHLYMGHLKLCFTRAWAIWLSPAIRKAVNLWIFTHFTLFYVWIRKVLHTHSLANWEQKETLTNRA